MLLLESLCKYTDTEIHNVKISTEDIFISFHFSDELHMVFYYKAQQIKSAVQMIETTRFGNFISDNLSIDLLRSN